MITFTGNGRLSRDVQLRTTRAGKTVATIAVARDRRDRNAEPVYLDLVVWEAQAKAAAEHLIKGQVVSFGCGGARRETFQNAEREPTASVSEVRTLGQDPPPCGLHRLRQCLKTSVGHHQHPHSRRLALADVRAIRRDGAPRTGATQ
jgi:hypothetical protein